MKQMKCELDFHEPQKVSKIDNNNNNKRKDQQRKKQTMLAKKTANARKAIKNRYNSNDDDNTDDDDRHRSQIGSLRVTVWQKRDHSMSRAAQTKSLKSCVEHTSGKAWWHGKGTN